MGEQFAIIDPKICIGCGECLAVCQFNAVKIAWDESTINLQKSGGVLSGYYEGKDREGRLLQFLDTYYKAL